MNINSIIFIPNRKCPFSLFWSSLFNAVFMEHNFLLNLWKKHPENTQPKYIQWTTIISAIWTFFGWKLSMMTKWIEIFFSLQKQKQKKKKRLEGTVQCLDGDVEKSNRWLLLYGFLCIRNNREKRFFVFGLWKHAKRWYKTKFHISALRIASTHVYVDVYPPSLVYSFHSFTQSLSFCFFYFVSFIHSFILLCIWSSRFALAILSLGDAPPFLVSVVRCFLYWC